MSQQLRHLLAEWQAEYQRLLEASALLLRNLDVHTPEDVADLIAGRQKIIDGFQKFDSEVRRCREGGTAGGDQRLLDDFESFRQTATAKILEMDAVVIGLARQRLEALQAEMATLTKRKSVATAYEDNGRTIR